MRGRRGNLAADTVVRSRRLRREAGEPERRLWHVLRQSLPETKFRRQVPLGPYHADFCSHGARLIVEVDGDDHATRIATDEARTRFLTDEGYRVIRFTNAEVMQMIDAVLASIAHALVEDGRP
ncbi:MAG: endonuclease domain-containing protein [Sphingomonas adhaesiva]|uniref:endonuclease domain-containing protein n=1 Tax=Sphingomonas adhaesiva TaxID=28212 RepID=UPI002FFA235E